MESSIANNASDVAKDSRRRITKALLTVFHDVVDASKIDPASYFGEDWSQRLKTWVAKWERCTTTSQLHAHIYLDMKSDQRIQINSLMDLVNPVSPRNNIKLPKYANIDCRKFMINYVLKPDTSEPGVEPYLWSVNKNEHFKFDQELWDQRKGKDKRTTAKDERDEKIIAFIESFPVWKSYDEILHTNLESKLLLAACGWSRKYHQSRLASEPRRTITEVVIMYGVGGSGKTTMAKNWNTGDVDEPEEYRYYRRNYDDGNFWGGGSTSYRGQRVIHFDEFNGQEKFSDFKEICDIGSQGKPINVKNSGAFLNHESVVLTSNVHPAYWYHNVWMKDKHMWSPFNRRVTTVLFFPELRPDGSRNEACSDKDYFYVDQTEEFRNFTTWEMAIEHSETHWPFNTGSNDTDVPMWKWSSEEGKFVCVGSKTKSFNP
jgi:hypothetical protein